MQKEGSTLSEIKGSEGIIIHNGNIILGMQQSTRWYKLENGKKAAIIKTIGGQIEESDGNDSRKALLRELIEEVKNIQINDIKMNNNPVFTKSIEIGDLNPYEKQLRLKMTADFYFLEILNITTIIPNDLPAILEIPIDKFLNLNLGEDKELKELEKHIIKNCKCNLELPEHYALMIPEDVKSILKSFKGDVKNKKNSI